MTLLKKSCPRCDGDMVQNYESDAPKCFQCGWADPEYKSRAERARKKRWQVGTPEWQEERRKPARAAERPEKGRR